MRSRLRPANIKLSVAFGVGTVLIYWAWAKGQEEPFDPIGFWALVIPPAIYAAGTWIYYRSQAPAQLFRAQSQQLEQFNPPAPWVVAVDVAEEERRITIQLLLRDRFTGTTAIKTATCFLAIGEVRLRCEEPKSGVVSQTQSIEWRYPDEFVPVVWPLPAGRYDAVVDGIRSSTTGDTIHSIGAQFQIGRARWGWRPSS